MHRFLSRLAATSALSLAAAGFAGCGGHHHHHDEGTLEIENDAGSTDVLDRVTIDEVGGPDFFDVDVFLAPGEVFGIDLFPATYDVTIFWHDGTFEEHTVDVFDDFITTLNVSN
jgi:hypothetical protein